MKRLLVVLAVGSSSCTLVGAGAGAGVGCLAGNTGLGATIGATIGLRVDIELVGDLMDLIF